MSTEKKPAPAHTSALAYTDCKHWGKGGQFTFDPETGLRTPTFIPGEVIPDEDAAGATPGTADVQVATEQATPALVAEAAAPAASDSVAPSHKPSKGVKAHG